VGTAILCIVWLFVGERVERRFEAMMVEVPVVGPTAPFSTVKSASATGEGPVADAATGEGSVAAATAREGSDAAPRTSAPTAPISEMALRARLADARFHVWDYSLVQWRDARLTGIGFGSMLPRAKHASEHDMTLTPEQRKGVAIGHPHSTWIQTLSETGLIGFSIYGAWVTVILVCAWSALAPAGHRTSSRVAGTAVHGGTSPTAFDSLTGPVPSWLDAGLLGAVVAFLVAAQFDCYQMNSTAFAIGLIPAAMLCRPRGAARSTAPPL
jgi:hypothetical protein